jgi:hypothetical protein
MRLSFGQWLARGAVGVNVAHAECGLNQRIRSSFARLATTRHRWKIREEIGCGLAEKEVE